MIHGLISLLYNGLLRGAAGAPLQRLTDCLPAWMAGWLDGCLAPSLTLTLPSLVLPPLPAAQD